MSVSVTGIYIGENCENGEHEDATHNVVAEFENRRIIEENIKKLVMFFQTH